MPSIVVMCDMKNIDTVKLASPVSTWIHSDKNLSEIHVSGIEELISLGCRNFLFTGNNSRNFEDFVDAIIEDKECDLILTASSNEFNEHCLEEFLSIKNINKIEIKSFIIFVLLKDGNEESFFLKRLRKMLHILGIEPKFLI